MKNCDTSKAFSKLAALVSRAQYFSLLFFAFHGGAGVELSKSQVFHTVLIFPSRTSLRDAESGLKKQQKNKWLVLLRSKRWFFSVLDMASSISDKWETTAGCCRSGAAVLQGWRKSRSWRAGHSVGQLGSRQKIGSWLVYAWTARCSTELA